MLNETELKLLLTDAETDRIERTVSVNNTDKFCEAVCAFANDLSNHRKLGYLIIGVDDDGVPQGLRITDQLLQNLGALRSDGNIQPLPVMSVDKYILPDGEIAVVSVHPSDLPPVRYKGRVYIRVGPRKATASEQDERVLSEKRIAHARSFDALPCREARLEDISLGQFEAYRQQAVSADVIAENHRTIVEQLASLRFFDPTQQSPTNAGLLLFAKNPRFFFLGDYIQFLQFGGTELNDLPIDQAEISGDMGTVMREIELRLKSLIRTSLLQGEGMREEVVADYPLMALRELVVNALVHRSYESSTPVRIYWFSDRVEIYSPGGLFGEATHENFPTRSSYRNPVLAEAMKTLGYVNRFGYGVQRAQKLLVANGNPEAEFVLDTNTVLVTVKGRQ